MSNIKKILSVGGGKKSIAKTIRFRETAIGALEKLAEISELSQNEIINIILEEAGKDMEMLEAIDKRLNSMSDDGQIVIEKLINYRLHYQYLIYKDRRLEIWIEDKNGFDRASMELDNVKFKNVSDLLSYGIDSECNIRDNYTVSRIRVSEDE